MLPPGVAVLACRRKAFRLGEEAEPLLLLLFRSLWKPRPFLTCSPMGSRSMSSPEGAGLEVPVGGGA